MVQFDPDTFQVAYYGGSIPLLPKEFALFQFLYEHAGRSFTRDELLDAVWPLEAPTDRTVDDHIYRIRKKLARLSHLLRIETIRGQGYKLTRLASKPQESPLLHDAQFAANVNSMLHKYHGLGMGAAMQLLSEHREILSLPGDPYYDAYLHFIRGDFAWLLSTDRIGSRMKLAYATFIHSAVQLGASSSLRYFDKLLAEDGLLSREWRYDLRLGRVLLYIEEGRMEHAQIELDSIRPDIAAMNSPSFTAVFLLKEMYVKLELGQLEEAEAKLEECEALLAGHPIQRERGACLVAKSILLYRQGHIPSARQALHEGMETLQQTQFLPHLLANLNIIIREFNKYPRDEVSRLKLQRQWDQLAAQLRFDELRALAEQLLDKHL